MALTFNQSTLAYVERKASSHVSWGERAVGFAGAWIGGFLDSAAAAMLNSVAERLDRDIVLFKGLRTVVAEQDATRVLDADLKVAKALSTLEAMVLELHRGAKDALSRPPRMTKADEASARVRDLSGALYQAINECKWAIAEHDADAQSVDRSKLPTFDDVEKLIADLKA